MVEMHCWETDLVHSWKKNNIQIIAGWKICTDHSPGWERTKVIPGNLLIRVLLEGENSYFFHSKFRNSLANFPWSFLA